MCGKQTTKIKDELEELREGQEAILDAIDASRSRSRSRSRRRRGRSNTRAASSDGSYEGLLPVEVTAVTNMDRRGRSRERRRRMESDDEEERATLQAGAAGPRAEARLEAHSRVQSKLAEAEARVRAQRLERDAKLQVGRVVLSPSFFPSFPLSLPPSLALSLPPPARTSFPFPFLVCRPNFPPYSLCATMQPTAILHLARSYCQC